jgi:hypothetical protein
MGKMCSNLLLVPLPLKVSCVAELARGIHGGIIYMSKAGFVPALALIWLNLGMGPLP